MEEHGSYKRYRGVYDIVQTGNAKRVGEALACLDYQGTEFKFEDRLKIIFENLSAYALNVWAAPQVETTDPALAHEMKKIRCTARYISSTALHVLFKAVTEKPRPLDEAVVCTIWAPHIAQTFDKFWPGNAKKTEAWLDQLITVQAQALANAP